MIDYCLEKARELPYNKGQKRHYAIVTDKRGRIVAEGANSYTKTNARQYRAAMKVGLPEKQYCHAEALALIRSRGKGEKLTVGRVNKKGEKMISKPCPVCLQLVQEHGNIKSVEFSV